MASRNFRVLVVHFCKNYHFKIFAKFYFMKFSLELSFQYIRVVRWLSVQKAYDIKIKQSRKFYFHIVLLSRIFARIKRTCHYYVKRHRYYVFQQFELIILIDEWYLVIKMSSYWFNNLKYAIFIRQICTTLFGMTRLF